MSEKYDSIYAALLDWGQYYLELLDAAADSYRINGQMPQDLLKAAQQITGVQEQLTQVVLNTSLGDDSLRQRAAKIVLGFPLHSAPFLPRWMEFEERDLWFERALAVSRAIATEQSGTELLLFWGISRHTAGDIQSAAALFQEALGEVSLLVDQDEGVTLHLRLLNGLGVCQFHLGRFHESFATFQHCLNVIEAHPERADSMRWRSVANNALGNALYRLARWAESEACYLSAETFLDQHVQSGAQDLLLKAKISINRANCYLPQARHLEALPAYEAAIAIAKQMRHGQEHGEWLRNLGAIQADLGLLQDAHTSFESCLDLVQGKNPVIQMICIGELGKLDVQEGQYLQAVRKFGQALAGARNGEDRFYTALWIGWLGRVALECEWWDEAGKLLTAALERFPVDNHEERAAIQILQALAARCQGNLDEAGFILSQALERVRQVDQRTLVAECLFWQSEQQGSQSRWKDALATLQEAQDIVGKSGLVLLEWIQHFLNLAQPAATGKEDAEAQRQFIHLAFTQGRRALALVYAREWHMDTAIWMLSTDDQAKIHRFVEDSLAELDGTKT